MMLYLWDEEGTCNEKVRQEIAKYLGITDTKAKDEWRLHRGLWPRQKY
ncbi:MAG: hypothetical protein ACLVIY_07585 [Anaerobutyricum soehngenii]